MNKFLPTMFLLSIAFSITFLFASMGVQAQEDQRRGYTHWYLPQTRINDAPLSRDEIAGVNVYYVGDDKTFATGHLNGAVSEFYTAPCAKGWYTFAVVDKAGLVSQQGARQYINKAWMLGCQ